ncbi:MAG: sensor histidine kinase [Verrucomicrobiaceae bacterium]|nr:MAG: sensor histidine kinase [Verrucomicrobiaceae bacterium]
MSNFEKDIAAVQGIPAAPTILQVVCQTTGMGFAAIARVTEERWIACSVLDKIQFGLKPGGELKVDSTICHEIRQSQDPVIIDHVACDPVYKDHKTPQLYGFQSYISVPILLPGGEFFGTLCAIDPRPARVNSPEIIGMFQLFAELIAFHLEAAEKVASTQSKLASELQVSELREQFIGVLGHDLRTPLGSILMGTELLAEGALDKDQIATLAVMKRSISKMSELIDDTLDLTRGRLGGGIPLEGKSDLPIQQIIEQVLDEARIRWQGRAVNVRFACKERIQYDPKRITQLFTNLISNAMVHGKPDHPVTVRASSEGGRFIFSVANAADPIPDPVLKRLFEPFSRGGKGNYKQGLGLGLYIASEIAKSHGGELRVTSTSNEVCFTFEMRSEPL